MDCFESKLLRIIKEFRVGEDCNTPDEILAGVVLDAIESFRKHAEMRDVHFGLVAKDPETYG
jgi:hypothetical protein